MMMHRLSIVLRPMAALMLIAQLSMPIEAAEPARKIGFNRDIQHILSDNCFKCHGPDSASREADLRLDHREGAIAELDKGRHAIVPGHADQSELIARITNANPKDRMPPADSGKSLTAKQIELLKAWINQGAEYEPHWSFIAPVRPEVPKVEHADWPVNAIDNFVLARLEREGWTPSEPADRVTLIRRVTLDLTGLPPTPEQVAAFVTDQSPNAYEKAVDRLLASPRYGERMAQVWLDVSRYADTMGYQADWERFQWRWREWVIDAFNRNEPYDQFTIDQLAGDLVPNATTEQIIATGFNRNHRINDEGGIIPAEFAAEYVIDRVDTTSEVWMGLTMGCARCHDHKFDPISQKDFYSFFAFFNNVPENGKDGRAGVATPYMRVAVRGEEAAYEKVKEQVAAAEKRLDEIASKHSQERKKWESDTLASLKADGKGWDAVDPVEVEATGGVSFTKLDDGSYLASGDNADDKPVYTVTIDLGQRKVTGLRLDALTHPSLGKGSLGISAGGNFVLTGFEVSVRNPGDAEPRPVSIADAEADYEQKGWPIKNTLDGKPGTGWAVDGNTRAENRSAVFTFKTPVMGRAGTQLIVTMKHESRYPREGIGRFVLSVTNLPKIELNNHGGLPQDVFAALTTAAKKRSADQNKRLDAYFLSTLADMKQAVADRAAAGKAQTEFEKESTTYVMVMKEMDKPRDSFVLNRGQYDQKREKVTANVPGALPALPEGMAHDRLALAQWLVSGHHPLTARVEVNRLWEMLFGTGLVKTSEDFGTQGEWPSHPELLDYLATELPRAGWDIKGMLKMMVMSATYRQSSLGRPETIERDPENRLLSHMTRVRLPAETIRDQALFAGGLLVEKIGGASVKPYQPEGLWEEVSFKDRKRSTDFYVQDHGEALYRRSLYTFWKRSVPPPALATFDAPTRETCTIRRSRTDTPLQALALMNDVTYVEAMRELATRAIKSAKTPDERIGFMFAALLARQPAAAELAVLRRGFDQRRATFASKPSDAASLIAEGEKPAAKDVDPVDLAAYTTVALNILNLDETINRE